MLAVSVVKAEASATTSYLKIKINGDIAFVSQMLTVLHHAHPGNSGIIVGVSKVVDGDIDVVIGGSSSVVFVVIEVVVVVVVIVVLIV